MNLPHTTLKSTVAFGHPWHLRTNLDVFAPSRSHPALSPSTVLSPSAALASASLEFCTAGRNKSLPSIRIEFGHRATFGNHACSRTPGVCPVHPCCKIRRTRQNGRPFCRNRYPARPAIHGQSTTSLLQNPSILQHESVCRLPARPPRWESRLQVGSLLKIPWIPHFRWLCWRLDRSGSPFPRNGSLTTELEPRNYSGCAFGLWADAITLRSHEHEAAHSVDDPGPGAVALAAVRTRPGPRPRRRPRPKGSRGSKKSSCSPA